MWNLRIRTFADMKEENRGILKTLPGVSDWLVNIWLEQVELIRQGKKVVENEITEVLRQNKIICYDIETNLQNDRVWLIGYFNFATDKFGFVFEKTDELNCLKRFLCYINQYPDFPLISFSNCLFEKRIIMERSRHHSLRELELQIQSRDVDLGISIPHILIGLEKYNLKDLAKDFGYRWENESIDGFYVGSEYSKFLATGEEIEWEKFIQYNEDDVLALKAIVDKIRELISQ